VALDAFPYNGGTTTMEAIWQGVPVLTYDGDRWASRTSQTLLRRTHLGDFVAASRQAYVDTAVAIAKDPQAPPRLSLLRNEMRDRLLASPACDAAGLARAMESIYLRIARDAS
jgi:predicted O-linked N-acetylglucosamine transferase (SPINDLY family)